MSQVEGAFGIVLSDTQVYLLQEVSVLSDIFILIVDLRFLSLYAVFPTIKELGQARRLAINQL